MNIVLVTCHDLGRFLGCYGISTIRTANLDRLASEGHLFRQAFATAPQCSPSRSSLFTGRYPHSNGVLGLTHGEFGWDLHPDELHLAQILKTAGYATSMVGILHEARSYDRCGFDDVSFPGHDARETTERAITRLRQLAERPEPFYIQIGYHEPHRVVAQSQRGIGVMGFSGDYIPPDDSLGVTVPSYVVDEPESRQEIAELQGAVQYLDHWVGVVLEEIERLGLDTNSLVIFTTDHGLALPRAKCSLYDPGLEVAMMMRLPGSLGAGPGTVTELVSNVDLLPTILDLAGVDIPERVQGKSVRALLEGRRDARTNKIFAEMTYHDYYHPQRCVRTSRFKLIVNFTTAPSFMDPSQSWHRRVRPVVPEEPALAYGPPIELYDLDADPNEWANLADSPECEDVRNELLAALHDWMRSTGDPILDGAVTPPRHRRVVESLERAAERAR